MPFFDYECKCGWTTYEMVWKYDEVVHCKKCKKKMTKLMGAPKLPGMVNGSSVGSDDYEHLYEK